MLTILKILIAKQCPTEILSQWMINKWKLSIIKLNNQHDLINQMNMTWLNVVPKCPQINNQHDLIKQISSVSAGKPLSPNVHTIVKQHPGQHLIIFTMQQCFHR